MPPSGWLEGHCLFSAILLRFVSWNVHIRARWTPGRRDGLDDRDRWAQDDREDPGAAVMLTAASLARMVVPSLALVAAGGALLLFGVPDGRRELPVDAGAATAARSTVGAASLAAPRRASDAGGEFTPIFDVARIDPTGDAVIAGREAYLAGRMEKKLYATASSPLEGVVR